MSCCKRSVAELVLEELLVPSVDDESSEGGGPGGGPPAPPGPLAKAALKTPLSSVARSLVSFPLETSLEIRSSIFDFRSPGDALLPLVRLLCNDESISVSADDSADWSDELIVPE